MKKKLIRFDWAVKKLLRNKANFVVLEGFLSELLFEDIKIIRILESEGNRETADDKYNRFDILTENSKKELVIIEIQNTYEIDYFQRMTYGVSKCVAEYLSKGQDYDDVKKVISINIVYFDLGQGLDYIYKGKTEFTGLHEKDLLKLSWRQREKFLKENVSDIFPEYYLLKVNNFSGNAKDTLDEWVYFLKNSEVLQDFKAKGLKEADYVLDIMRLDNDATYSYNRHLDSLRIKRSEMMSAKEVIRTQERLDIAKNMIEEGFDNAMIKKMTRLPFEVIDKLRDGVDDELLLY